MSHLDLTLCEGPKHYVNGEMMFADVPEGMEQVQLGFGCFWGAERILWKLDGVHVTSVGYSGGHAPKPDYKLVCTGTTGHAEMCHVVFDPSILSFEALLKVFFEHRNIVQLFSLIMMRRWKPQRRLLRVTLRPMVVRLRQSYVRRQTCTMRLRTIINSTLRKTRKAIACMARQAFSARYQSRRSLRLRGLSTLYRLCVEIRVDGSH